jgi:septum formation protein
MTAPSNFILASASPIRAQMLREAGCVFDVIAAPDSAEEATKSTLADAPPPERARLLAIAKAKAVSLTHPERLVVGADQVCALGKNILSKPGSRKRATQQLQALSGQTHHQHSAACILRNGELLWSEVATAHLTMHPLSLTAITDYLDRDQPFGSCGSYRFEGTGKALFSRIEGDAFTIQGLPLIPLLSALQRVA